VSHHLLSRPETVQTATLCRTVCYCELGGRPKNICHVPQQFKPLACVAPVVTVRVADVPSPPVTSSKQFKPLGCVAPVVTVRVAGVPSPPATYCNSSNRWAVSPRVLL
jgi:hypothetical protein